MSCKIKYNTGNPLCSSDPRDLSDNAQIIDSYVNSTELTQDDRFGMPRKTWAGIEKEAQDQIDSLEPRMEQLIDDKIIAQGGFEIAQEWGDSPDKTLSQEFVTHNLGYVTPEMFGAKGDGVTDDSTALNTATIQARINNTYVLCGGTYLISTRVEIDTVMLHGGVFLIDGGGFDFLPASVKNVTYGFDGSSFKLLSNTSNVITTPATSSNYIANRASIKLLNLNFYGLNQNAGKYAQVYDEGAETYIMLGDAYNCDLFGISIIGSYDIKQNPDTQLKCIGISASATSALMTARMSNISISGCHTSIDIGDRVFYSLTAFDLIGSHIGIKNDSLNNFNEPKIFNGNINAQEIGISLANSGSREIDSVTIRRHRSGWKEATHDWFGIKVVKCNDLTISSNIFHVDAGGGAFNGVSYGAFFQECSLFKVVDNFVSAGVSKGLVFDNCTGFTESGTISAQNNVNDVVKTLLNNSRLYNINLSSLVSTFKGQEVYTDATSKPSNKSTLRSTGSDIVCALNPIIRETIVSNAPVDSKGWKDIHSLNTRYMQVVSDDGKGVNYDILTREGSALSSRELRARDFVHINTPELRLNHAPVIVSDKRKKEGIADIGDNYLKVIESLQFKQYTYKGDDKLLFGVIAQDWIEACEDNGADPYESGVLVGNEEDGYSIRYGELQNLFNAYILSKLHGK